MMTLISFIALLWTIRILFNIMSFTHLWWVKEYRWDRMFIHLRTPQGRMVYFLPWRRPRISPKSVALLCVTYGLLILFGISSPYPLFWTLFIADVLSFPLTFMLVGVLQIPTIMYHRMVIDQAVGALRSRPDLFVIGITGSYGKTSTKDYLYTLLSSEYSTLKTEASKNAPIGIAEVVNASLKSSHAWFIVEMGAYKKGEVAYMASMVKPQVAIITAINAQHQDLFGSIENTMHAKYELVAGLHGKKIAIMNADDERVREMGGWASGDMVNVWWYGKNVTGVSGERIFAISDVVTNPKHVTFTLSMGKEKVMVDAPVVGAHQASNISAAIAGAVASGMSFVNAAAAASHLKPTHSVLEYKKGSHGRTVIDDTFNNNPDAARAALDVLSKEKGKRILVFQPMVELGAYAHQAHEDVGAYAARTCDAVILTNANWSKDFIRGAQSVHRTFPVVILSGLRALRYIRTLAPEGGTVLGKGKEASRILALLK